MSDDRYLILWDRNGDSVRLAAHEADVLETRVSEYRIGGASDGLLELQTTEGASFWVVISHIASWLESTPASRERCRELDARLKAEHSPTWEPDS